MKAYLAADGMDARRSPKRVVDAHPPDPPRGRDFQRQKQRCQRTSVSGRMIVRTFRIDGNRRYSWIKNQRSLFVSRTRPCILRRKTTNWRAGNSNAPARAKARGPVPDA
jgi:hypothetical protein